MQPLATPARLEAYTGGQVSPKRPGVEELLKGASTAVRRYCGWHISPPKREELVVDTNGGELLQLPTLRLIDVHRVSPHGRDPVDGADVEWSATGTLRAAGRWPNRFRGVRVEVTHGYQMDEADDVAQIVCQAVANALASPLGATREQAGVTSVSWATTAPGVAGGLSLLERDLAILAPYRLASIA